MTPQTIGLLILMFTCGIWAGIIFTVVNQNFPMVIHRAIQGLYLCVIITVLVIGLAIVGSLF